MTPDHSNNRRETEVFTAGKELVNAAKTLLERNPPFIGAASFLCFQSAKQMMAAFLTLRSRVLMEDSGCTVDYWNTCTDEQPELDEVDDEVHFLLDCEWASYPPDEKKEPLTAEYALKAISCAEKLELALLEAAPGLAPQRDEQEIESHLKRQQRIGIVQATENGQTSYYQSDMLIHQQAIARRCAVALRDKEAVRDKDFTSSAFIIRRPISQEAFEHYCSHPTDGPTVTAIAAVDFDKGSFSMPYSDGWRTYPIKEVAKAANATSRLTRVTENQRYSAFLEKLADIEPLETVQEPTQGMSL